MQVDTMLKFGSLALNVVQDDNVRQLLTMVHKGAKRRGFIAPMQLPGAQATAPAPTPAGTPAQSAHAHPVPFSPIQHVPQSGPDMSKYMTMDNAKKVMSWVGQVSSLLMK